MDANEIRLQAAIRKVGNNFPKIARLIDGEKRQRRKRNPGWRKNQTLQQRAFWGFIKALRTLCALEARITSAEKELGLKPSKASQAWQERLARIENQRADIEREAA